jgi:hypothetical protein
MIFVWCLLGLLLIVLVLMWLGGAVFAEAMEQAEKII